MSRSRQHIEFLDYVRGIAIIAVFLFHLLGAVCGVSHLPWGSWFSQFEASKAYWFLLPFSLGWCGVAIFFVVSGFCIHLSFKSKPVWHEFLLRRFFRIYPAYVTALLVFALLVPWTRIHFSMTGAAQLGSHLALIHNFDNRTFYGINVAFWSIAVEVQLYLLYPLLLMLVSRIGWQRTLFYIAALEIGLRGISSLFLVSTGDIPYWFLGLPFMYWFSWSLGAVIADAYFCGRPLPFASHSAWFWGGIAVGSVFVKPLFSFSFLFFSIATAVVISKQLCQPQVTIKLPVWISRHIKTAGVWSYSIYLLHAPFLYGACAPALAIYIAATFHLAHLPHSLIVLIVGLGLWPLIVALSGLSYHLVELPSIVCGKRFIMLCYNGWSHKKETREPSDLNKATQIIPPGN